ncbi:MAG: cytochrome c oxidase accessory protein CcoG [Gammaproteobacteria bacterium]|nr:cytochrome c oxidase accessory protein CcoG [Gammaproteobacteria bacterium]MDH5302667.1 cytochrome c oxidase accessory protein CcoG [Gammaproteobacteria bacterium]MDH5320896.1 cytochrome c oxidase accessory protein CcoG [Gammaproteobacteria bacterium]
MAKQSGSNFQYGQLYRSEDKVYPREVSGRFARLRRLAMFVLLGAFYIGPWLVWDGRQAILFDLPARKFYILGMTLWPQDFVYLALLLIILAVSLFFFTALAGRLWCGFACPQTVWTEAFTWIEMAVEGNRSQRMKLDVAPWTVDKIRKKALKQFLWIALALFTGFSFVGYFSAVRPLAINLVNFEANAWAVFWVLFYGFATYGNAGYMREQVCKYMCPYARFQGAMFDHDTLIISYDAERGEPRGSRRRGSDAKAQGLGDCIDCTMCVQVCPTGIDIREGLQYECIACAACIDACDTIMDKVGSPRGLIRYSTEHALEHKSYRLWRPRTLVYSAILVLLLTAMVTSMALRKPAILDVIRDRNALYRDVGRQGIENSFTVRVINKQNNAHPFTLSVSGIEGLKINTDTDFVVEGESVMTLPVSLTAPHESAVGGNVINFELRSTDGSNIYVTEESRFRGPAENR